MPFRVRTRTVTSCPLGLSSVTSNSAVPPSVTVLSLIDSLGASSSSRMVPVPVSSSSVAPLGLLSFTVKSSSGSSSASSVVCTWTVLTLSFGSNRSVPDFPSKSVFSRAVPLSVS